MNPLHQILVFIVCFAPSAISVCPNGWASYGNHCYLLSSTQWDFNTARTLCQQREGDLVSFQTVEEREFVKSLGQGARVEYWIGISRADSGSDFKWTDGTLPPPTDDSIQDWNTEEDCPAACNGDCVILNHWNGKWNNIPCGWSYRSICKRRNDILDACDLDGGWHPYNKQCYKYFETRKSWSDAKADCKDANGQLVLLNTRDKFNTLEEVIACRDFESGIWIGLSDTTTGAMDNLNWIDGSSLIEANWDANQPRNASLGGNNCVKSLPVSSFKWVVDTCDRENEYVCERKEGTCAEGWQDGGTGYCYHVFGLTMFNSLTWTDAENYCMATGGHLMKIENNQQQAILQRFAEDLAIAQIGHVWIGLSDKQLDNYFRWSDGATVIYQKYGNMMNVTRRYDCGFVSTADSSASWNTDYCFHRRAFICQVPLHKAPIDPPTPGQWLCDDGWIADQNTGICYQFSQNQVSYDEAKSDCPGNSILIVHNANDQSFLSERLLGDTWIGLEYSNGRHQWHDGSPLSFENWENGGFADAAAKPCTRMVLESGNRGSWLNEVCSEKRYFVCTQSARHVTGSTIPPTPTAPWTALCGSGWSYNRNAQACYKFISTRVTWEDAEARCQAEGSHLLSVHGQAEMDYINALIFSSSSSINYWIGGNDLDRTRGWVWSDGSPYYYWNWNDDEPNNKGGMEFCIEMSADMGGRWNDINCDTKFSFICKKLTVTATPLPSVEPTKPPVVCNQHQALLSGAHYIRDIGFSASSNKSGRLPAYGRLNHMPGSNIGGSWTADDSDNVKWLGVAFTNYMVIYGIQTQGAGDKDEWVTSFYLSYRTQYGSFYEFIRTNDGGIRYFDGNSNTNSIVEYIFDAPLLAHSFRIHPVSFQGAASLRFELLGCLYETCNYEPVVSGELRVVDMKMTSSGSYDTSHTALQARMSSVGWIPSQPFSQTQWIQMEFDSYMAIYGIQTKGSADHANWITSYKLSYKSEESDAFETYQEPYGTDKVIPGNTDQNSEATYWLAGNIYRVKYVRISPQSWQNGVGLRLEILGCNAHFYGCEDVPLITGPHHRVADSRLTASSSLSGETGPARSRLNQGAYMGLAGGWVPAFSDDKQWIQADLGRSSLIMAVATQGRSDVNSFVTFFYLSRSYDGQSFDEYTAEGGQRKVFVGNSDQFTVHKSILEPAFNARYVRLHPLAAFPTIGLRWEIYACAGWAAPSVIGCYADRENPRDLEGDREMFVPEGMTQDKCVQFCRERNYLYAGVQYGQECFCGNTYGRYGTSTECTIPCSGDRSLGSMCGGHWSNTVMHTGVFSPDQYLGCYSDNWERDLPYEHYMTVPGGNTIQYCVMHCFNKGYLYAGAEFGDECYCGNSYGRYGPSPRCNSTCPGDHTGQTICGGEWSLSVWSTGIAGDLPRCRDGWVPFLSQCYQFNQEKTTWAKALASCQAARSDLATINYAVQNDFLTSQLAQLRSWMWIGMHCQRQNNYFEWTSGSPVLYTNWAVREPNNAGVNEDCVMVYDNGRWNDDPCNSDSPDKQFGYVCQAPKEDIPDVSTPAPDPTCPQGWQSYRWKCFTVVGTLNWNWQQAKEQCEGLGGALARIGDIQEQSFLASTYFVDRGSYWTDLRERDFLFIWSNGQHPPFTHWGPNQPADAVLGDSCVIIDMEEYGLWKNIPCGERTRAICEVVRTGWTTPLPVVTDPGQGTCASGWTSLQGTAFCFLINALTVNMRKTWTEARQACLDIGADLVSIHSREENNQILIYTMSKPGDFWIGGYRASEGFVWSDESPFDFAYWSGPGLFEGGQHSLLADGEDCIDIYQATGTWNQRQCDIKRNWICKIRRGVVPGTTPAVTAPTAGPSGSCSPDDDNWRFFEDRCYLFTGRTYPPRDSPEYILEYDWWTAEDKCRQYGGHLASIHSTAEQEFIKGQLSQMNVESFNVWIGLSELNSVGSWKWSDDTPIDYINWGNLEPDGEGMCVTLETHTAAYGTWNDQHCQRSLPFVCVKQKGRATITTVTPPPMSGYCPDGYLTYGNKCFKFFDEDVSWQQAHENCQKSNPSPFSLASVSNPWEQGFLQGQMLGRTPDRYWIGLYHYLEGQHEFGWVDQSQVTFTNWARGEPNGGVDERCVDMYSTPFRAGQWNDEICTLQYAYICMRMKDPSLPPPVEPSSTCPSGYVEFGGNCYKADRSTRTWQEAENVCSGEGGHLTGIFSRFEQGFLIGQFYDIDTNIWIGLSDRQSAGRYTWSDKGTLVFTSWGEGKPSITDGGCAHLSRDLSGNWADSRCDVSYSSICKITRVPPPYPDPPTDGTCPNGEWIGFGSHCYIFRPSDYLSQAEAAQNCTFLRGTLASIHSDEENKFIFDHVVLNTGQNPWIGLIRSAPDSFVWMDGSSETYFNWDVGEPNNGANADENCVEMFNHNGKWNDVACGIRNGYVCKTRQIFDGEQSSRTTPPTPVTTPIPTVSLSPPTVVSTTAFVAVPTTPAPSYPAVIPTSARNVGGVVGGPLPPGSVVGIVFGCVVIAMLIVFIGLMYLGRRRQAEQESHGFENPSFQATSQQSISESAAKTPTYDTKAAEAVVDFGTEDVEA